MNSHIEEVYKITIGRKEIDVSNVSVEKSLQGLEEYNKNVALVQDEKMSVEEFNKAVDEIGLKLIKHKYEALRIRFNVFKSIIEILKRFFIREKHVYAMNKDNYNEWQAWVYFAITGNKKKDLETEADLMKTTREIYSRMRADLNLDQEQCTELLMTLLKDQAKQLKIYTKDHKVS